MKSFLHASGFLRTSKSLYQYTRQMGVRKTLFRVTYELQRRAGILRLRFPASVRAQAVPDLEHWKKQSVLFFFNGKPTCEKFNQYLSDDDLYALKKMADAIYIQKYRLFHGDTYHLTDWHTNPLSGFRYDSDQHWSAIRDMDPNAGDIKFVWEKSRFCFLMPLIRHDFFSNEDHSEIVFQRIIDWIHKNPVNRGPNWMCSQEISIRVLQWLFALHYYKNSPNLTTVRFDQIVQSIYDQIRHVADNLDFSRKFVQNNHALTETAALFSTGLLLPFFSDSASWMKLGVKAFTEEVIKQVAEDGEYCQHSMNYHRMVVQLLSWVIRLADLNAVKLDPLVRQRAQACVTFLRAFQDQQSGWLPNYGPNDGTLLFDLNASGYRDFRPQLNALATILNIEQNPAFEEAGWLSGFSKPLNRGQSILKQGVKSFSNSGYYRIRDGTALLFLRCGSYKTRPFQADNNHLDLWVDGTNLLRDAGTYLYNGHPNDDFSASGCHNTIVIGAENQMQKGVRFIWLNWITEATGRCWETDEAFFMEGTFEGFRYGRNYPVQHRRLVTKQKGAVYITVEDWISHLPDGQTVSQVWHLCPEFLERYTMEAFDENLKTLGPGDSQDWYAETYGKSALNPRRTFSGQLSYIRTIIKLHT